jgi:predicted O-methyltransferase YrrM
LRVTAASALVHLLGATALHVLWGRGRAVEVAVVVSAMAAAILVSAVLLVPDFGALGAAWSTFVPMLIGSIYLVRSAGILCEVSQFEVLRQALRGLLFPSVVTLLVALTLPQWLGAGGWLSLLATCMAAGLLFFTAFFTMGKGLEERRLLFDVFFRGRPPGGGGESTRRLRKPRWLRSIRDFLANLRFYLYDETHTRRDYYETLFRNEGDPWRYETMPERGANRHAGALALLEAALAAPGRFESCLEVGCAEGLFTKPLATRCRRLLAVDISDIALDRAREYCRDSDGVEFRSWDLLRDPLLPERFDLVVVMGVLDNFVRLGQLRVLRERIIALLQPGGYLLVESTRMGGDLEDSWWRRVLHRGKWLNHYVAQHPSLETVDVRIDMVCVQTLLRKRP